MSDYLKNKYKDEAACVADLLESLNWTESFARAAHDRSTVLVEKLAGEKIGVGTLEQFLSQYSLDSDEGRALMTLAEAFLRIPDKATKAALLKDRLQAAEWGKGGSGEDWFAKMSGMGLSLSKGTMNTFFGKLGEPVIRQAMSTAIKVMGKEFVLGQTIEEALRNSVSENHMRSSFDMLGEGARTRKDAQNYLDKYAYAIEQISENKHPGNGISVKLSALHPRYDYAHKDTCVPELCESLRHLTSLAAKYDIALTVDAEECNRLDLSLEIFDRVLRNVPANWNKFGLAVQAYHKRTPDVIDYIAELAGQSGHHIPVRLVKGAYWDTEIKYAQANGFKDYPVFTRKCNTDLSYLACAQKMLSLRTRIYPMFATHNAYTISAILELAGPDRKNFEFQRLYGMGKSLYKVFSEDHDIPVTVYAPVGSHENLLPYLVRRLLENGANSSFVNKLYAYISDRKNQDLEDLGLLRDPVAEARLSETKRHPKIPMPSEIYAPSRKNSVGLDIKYDHDLKPIRDKIEKEYKHFNLSEFPYADANYIKGSVQKAVQAYPQWNKTPSSQRAEILNKIADLYEEHLPSLMAILTKEGLKTTADARDEVREAVDFCRYYAAQGAPLFDGKGTLLPGPTGEDNRLIVEGRGAFVCISPWNFPLAIFTGQVVAALMAGNSVLAKPAEQTPHIAKYAVDLMYEAGVPRHALQLVIGDGRTGHELVSHPSIAGVAFTGSMEAAQIINRTLAEKDGAITPLIAETGGQNAMIVDSSALLEQVVDDVLHSAFGSAGQRCSALRVLYVQKSIANEFFDMLEGAMQELKVGHPLELSSDVGPVIDGAAHNKLVQHRKYLEANARTIAQVPLDPDLNDSFFFFAPCAFEIDSIDLLKGEVFGPILHVITYDAANLDKVIADINATGFGLTFGAHSRIKTSWSDMAQKIHAGNLYINRSMTGAVVGTQPFGGRGLSGTGPKAGGPHYLPAFAHEKVITENTTASGGNASLVSLTE